MKLLVLAVHMQELEACLTTPVAFATPPLELLVHPPQILLLFSCCSGQAETYLLQLLQTYLITVATNHTI